MNETLRRLKEIQQLDTQISQLSRDAEEKNTSVNKLQENIQEEKDALSTKREEIMVVRSSADRHELDLKTNEERINKFRSQLSDAKTNKEYSTLLSEIGSVEADNSLLEDKILEIMSRADEIAQACNMLEDDIKQKEGDLVELRKQTEIEIRSLKQQQADIETKRTTITQQVDAEKIQDYERILAHNNPAVCALLDGVCQGCHMTVPPQTLNLVLSDQGISHCHSCSRILYIDEPAVQDASE